MVEMLTQTLFLEIWGGEGGVDLRWMENGIYLRPKVEGGVGNNFFGAWVSWKFISLMVKKALF